MEKEKLTSLFSISPSDPPQSTPLIISASTTLSGGTSTPAATTPSTSESESDLNGAVGGSSPGFEGPEKLLEIWFKRAGSSSRQNSPTLPPSSAKSANGQPTGLRRIKQEKWSELLKLVKCEIVSKISNDHVDAYLLRVESESSMFVFDNRLIMKTCGTTTLLMCLELLLEYSSSVGLDIVEYVFYSRKSYMFPHVQKFPHDDWTSEVTWLERYFSDGSAYLVGRTNGDHWYTFLWEETRKVEAHFENGEPDGFTLKRVYPSTQDHTLEILMSDMDAESAKKWFKNEAYSSDGGVIGTSELQEIFPQVTFDDFVFEPCGYSCNGLDSAGGYLTVHVTPEAHCSFASFETNIQPQNCSLNYAQIVDKVIRVFKPRKFTVTLFAETPTDEYHLADHYLKGYTIGEVISGYFRRDLITYRCENYDLFFYHYDSCAPLQLSPANKRYR